MKTCKTCSRKVRRSIDNGQVKTGGHKESLFRKTLLFGLAEGRYDELTSYILGCHILVTNRKFGGEYG